MTSLQKCIDPKRTCTYHATSVVSISKSEVKLQCCSMWADLDGKVIHECEPEFKVQIITEPEEPERIITSEFKLEYLEGYTT